MRVKYVRVSSLDQKTDRQTVNSASYDLVVEDKCSGTIPFFEREGGKKIKLLVEKGCNMELDVHAIDRIGRDLLDIYNTILFFNSHKISIYFVSQELATLNDKGEENAVAKMVISILGVVAEMEKKNINERTREGIEIAKALGKYKGRNQGSKEDVHQFLSKPKNKKALDYVRKGYKNSEISKITKLSVNTVVKIRKYANAS
ncbi:MAG: recombinase family protein [Bacteroidetes bacterium]|nr:recombinase family protein [Bacteroidota bacterium]